MCRIVDVLVRIDIALLAHGKPSAARQGAPHTTQRRERDASARGLPCWVVTLKAGVFIIMRKIVRSYATSPSPRRFHVFSSTYAMWQ